MRKSHPLIIPTAVALSLSFSTAVYADTTALQKAPEHWQCKWCTFDEAIGQFWQIDLGLQAISKDNEVFGRYNGMEEQGSFGVLGFSGKTLNEDGMYFSAEGEQLMLDHRKLKFSNGIQGVYDIKLGYQETKQFNGRVGTPFSVDANNQLVLPADWVSGQNSDDFTKLTNSLHTVELDASRKRLNLAAKIVSRENLPTFALDYKKDSKSGVRGAGGMIGTDNAFFANSSLLPLPFDHQTEQVDASVSYAMDTWLFKAGYYSSVFKDQGSATTWQNPFSQGYDWGRSSSDPDNRFQQLYFSSSYRFNPTDYQRVSVATGYLAFGQMKQNEQYSALSINPLFSNLSLPRTSLDGRVDTITANLKVVSPLNSNWRVKGSVRYNEKDNQTAINPYESVVADTVLSDAVRLNVPYSYIKSETKMSASYNHLQGTTSRFGVEYEEYDRTYQERKETSEVALWFEQSGIWSDSFSSRFKAEMSERDGDGYREIGNILPPQNPLMRKFYLADRKRKHVLLDMFYLYSETLNVNVLFDFGEDDYLHSSIGLQKTNYRNVNIDLSWMSSEELTVYGYLNNEFFRSRQAGSQTFAAADWFNHSKDNTYTAGFGLNYVVVEDELDVGIDLVYSKTKEENVLTGDSLVLASESLPDVEVELASVEFYADLQLSETLSFKTRLVWQSYEDDMIEDYALTADSVEDVLLFNRLDQDIDVSYITASFTYKF